MVVALLAVAVWWLQGGDGSDEGRDATAEPTTSLTAPAEPSASTVTPSVAPATSEAAPETGAGMPPYDDLSGLPYVALGDLPPEAADVVDLIGTGGPFPYDKDGSTFGNYEGLLPDAPDGYYREYTVETPGSDDRGARRIVGGADGELYWTEDHYESFEVIWR
ncbi:ribonuclease domain-containing protein [Nocardioides stalactiti]|uniref:ribonuclease domain-containing protein n=1 Tax=Nocardioides stalactiti TaxID=2755356 RepID=UPI0028B0F81D|nr:ribonuclease domain-containing protein [Nocardioides stalactiti]